MSIFNDVILFLLPIIPSSALIILYNFLHWRYTHIVLKINSIDKMRLHVNLTIKYIERCIKLLDDYAQLIKLETKITKDILEFYQIRKTKSTKDIVEFCQVRELLLASRSTLKKAIDIIDNEYLKIDDIHKNSIHHVLEAMFLINEKLALMSDLDSRVKTAVDKDGMKHSLAMILAELKKALNELPA